MGKKPDKTYTLERIDVNLGYSKDNCKWITRFDQGKNKRSNNLITYNNKTQSLRDWSRECFIPQETIKNRLNKGWNIDKIFTTPTQASIRMKFEHDAINNYPEAVSLLKFIMAEEGHRLPDYMQDDVNKFLKKIEDGK